MVITAFLLCFLDYSVLLVLLPLSLLLVGCRKLRTKSWSPGHPVRCARVNACSQCLGLRMESLGIRVQGLGFRMKSLGVRG